MIDDRQLARYIREEIKECNDDFNNPHLYLTNDETKYLEGYRMALVHMAAIFDLSLEDHEEKENQKETTR